MRLDFTEVINGRKTEFDFNIEYELTAEQVEYLSLTSPGILKIKGKALLTGKSKAMLDIEYQVELDYPCSRCLKNVKKVVENHFEKEVYLKMPEILEDEECFYLEGGALDITEMMIEDLILNLPMQVVCSEDCKGICPKCGVNLNEQSCTCEEEAIDPRMEALKKFFT